MPPFTMNNSHRMFLQAFLTRYTLNSREVKELYRSACDQFNEEADEKQLGHFVKTINSNIEANHLEIKKAVCEDTGANFYCLVNTADNNITRLASEYTPNELELFKQLVKKIVEEEGSVASIAALNLVDTLNKRMSKQDAQLLLDRFQRGKWITMNDGQVSLSPQCITELHAYITQQYPDHAIKCYLCSVLCLKGQNCDVCDVKLHLVCASRYFRDQSEPRCPGEHCKALWPHTVLRISKQPSNRARSDTQQMESSQQASTSTPALQQTRKRNVQDR